MYIPNYYLILFISIFLCYSFGEIRNGDLNHTAQCNLHSHPSVIYRCLVTGRVEGSRACKKYESDGTVVRPQCLSPYYYSSMVLTHMLCIDGSWNYTAKCTPDCGKVSSIGTPLVIGGESAERAEVPWHAGIYAKTTSPYQQICGGSLISNNIVLSAAHCFWSDFESNQRPAADFAVAVGKLYRPWEKDEDNAQRSNVTALHLPPLFQGSTANYQEDIAVVVVTIPFQFTKFVGPVCVDFNNFFQNKQLQVGNMGKVAGWGLTSVNGTRSQTLKVIDLPIVSTETCVNESPPDFRGHITGDKICAGFRNGLKGVCKGDSGGGLAFPEREKDTPRFYLRGIVSTAPTNNALCNVNFYTTFTQLLRHEYLIKQFLENGEPCHLKPHRSVEYRCLAFGNAESYRPCNEYEIEGTVVSPQCRSPGYYFATALSLMTCVEGNWTYIAKCSEEPCQLKPHRSVEYRCLAFGNAESYRPCNEYEIAGTVVSPQCRSPGFYSATALSLMTCVEGNWTYIAKCSEDLLCKEESIDPYHRETSLLSMDNETLTHATLKRDSAGLLAYFEMHIAIQADKSMIIRLYDKVDHPDIPYNISNDTKKMDKIDKKDVGSYSNQYTSLNYKGTLHQESHTPGILSSTQFRSFYIKVDDGILQFGKEGDSSPLISYNDTLVGSLNYFAFRYLGSKKATIRYDCLVRGSEHS